MARYLLRRRVQPTAQRVRVGGVESRCRRQPDHSEDLGRDLLPLVRHDAKVGALRAGNPDCRCGLPSRTGLPKLETNPVGELGCLGGDASSALLDHGLDESFRSRAIGEIFWRFAAGGLK